jgi:hypothetical protein
MPILVSCPGCKAQFHVSEKFAGKKGPCPKCKAVITIPAAATASATVPTAGGAKSAPGAPPAPKAADVKIHAPEEALKSEKSKTGRPTLKPIFHHDLRLTWKSGLTVIGTIVVLFAAAWLGGKFVRAPVPLLPVQQTDASLVAQRRMQLVPIYALRTIGLLLIGAPIVVAGYHVLRDDELEPYRGRSLLWRSLICLVVYIGVWGLYALIPADLKSEGYLWLFFAPALILPAAVAAYFCFDLDYLGAAIHASFFLLVTLALGWTAGLTMPWMSPHDRAVLSVPSDVKLEVEYQR